jgi:hypothetical protein
MVQIAFAIFSTFMLYACRFGGDKEIRTPDLLLARQALSQLSYTPIYIIKIV